MSGFKIAALYGLRPHLLGLCGPKEALAQQVLKKFLQGQIPAKKIREVLQGFKGAYSYYKLIAKSNKIKDPFDKRVVRAYWIGNKLLDQVKINNLREMIIKDFAGSGLLSKEVALKKANEISETSKPHHSFHVLVIGSVTGSVDFRNTKLRDLCRIAWGRVIKINPVLNTGEKLKIKNIIIEYQPLVGEKKIKLGKPIKKEIIWDREIVPKVKIGDWVSFHWNWLVQVLTKKEVANLKKYTKNTVCILLPERSRRL